MPTIQVPLTRILPNPWQTRQAINQEHITALADDIQANDLLQKPSGRLVDPDEHIGLTLPDLYAFDNWPALDADFPGIMVQLEFGHNRFEAFKILAARGAVWASMPVDIRPLTNEQMADHAWSENERRRDHTPIERALAIQQRMNDFGWTQAQVAEHLQISRPVVGNSLRLLKLPEDVQQALASGNISERIAMALVSLFALPEALRQKAESGYDGHRPSIIVRQALEGSVSSDAIRERVESICRNVGRKLEDAGWSLDDVFAIENVTAPTCRDCDKRLEERNLCLLPQCYDLKALEAKRLYLEKASQACGISADTTRDGNTYGSPWTEFWSYEFSHNGRLEKIKATNCENLRIVYNGSEKGYSNSAHDRVDGHPHAQIVCSKRKGFCTCLKALEATVHVEDGYNEEGRWQRTETPTGIEISEAPDAAELAQVAQAARIRKKEEIALIKDTGAAVAERLTGAVLTNNAGAWRLIAEKVRYNLKPDGSAYDVCLAIMQYLIDAELFNIDHFDTAAKKLSKLLTACNLEPLQDERTQEEKFPHGKPLIEVWGDPEPALAEVFGEEE